MPTATLPASGSGSGKRPKEEEACDLMARTLFSMLGSLDAVLPASILAERGTTLVEQFCLELEAAGREGRPLADQRREMQRMLAQIKDAVGEQRKGAPMSRAAAGERLARRLVERLRDAVRFRFLDAAPPGPPASLPRDHAAFLHRFARLPRPPTGTPIPLDGPATPPPPAPRPRRSLPRRRPRSRRSLPAGACRASWRRGSRPPARRRAAPPLPPPLDVHLIPAPTPLATSELVHLVLPELSFDAPSPGEGSGEGAESSGGTPAATERRPSFPSLLAPIELPGPKNVDIIYRGEGGHGRPAAGGLVSRSFEILRSGVPESVRMHRLSVIEEDQLSTPDGEPPPSARSAPASAFARAESFSYYEEAEGGAPREATPPPALRAFVDAVLASAARRLAGSRPRPARRPPRRRPRPRPPSSPPSTRSPRRSSPRPPRPSRGPPGPRRPRAGSRERGRAGTPEEVAGALERAARAVEAALEAERAEAEGRRAASPLVDEAIAEAAVRSAAAWLAPGGPDAAVLEAFAQALLDAAAAAAGPRSPSPRPRRDAEPAPGARAGAPAPPPPPPPREPTPAREPTPDAVAAVLRAAIAAAAARAAGDR
eukprot:tig00000403_g308.t1